MFAVPVVEQRRKTSATVRRLPRFCAGPAAKEDPGTGSRVAINKARGRLSSPQARGHVRPRKHVFLAGRPWERAAGKPAQARRPVQGRALSALVGLTRRLGLRGGLDDKLAADDHVSKERQVGRRAFRRELGAEQGDQGPGNVVAKGCTDGSGTSIWHPVAWGPLHERESWRRGMRDIPWALTDPPVMLGDISRSPGFFSIWDGLVRSRGQPRKRQPRGPPPTLGYPKHLKKGVMRTRPML